MYSCLLGIRKQTSGYRSLFLLWVAETYSTPSSEAKCRFRPDTFPRGQKAPKPAIGRASVRRAVMILGIHRSADNMSVSLSRAGVAGKTESDSIQSFLPEYG